MPKNFLSVPLTHKVYYKLPEGIETLDDDRIEYSYFRYYLFIKLKDQKDEIEIEPLFENDENCYYEDKKVEYLDKEDVPYGCLSDEESDEED